MVSPDEGIGGQAAGAGAPAMSPGPANLDLANHPERATQLLVESFRSSHPNPLANWTGELSTSAAKHELFEKHVAYMGEFLKWTHRALEGDKPLEPCGTYPLKVWRPTKDELENPKREMLEKLAAPILSEMESQWRDLARISRIILSDFDNEPNKVRDEELKVLRASYAKELHAYLEMSPFAHRLIHKPEGYGDYGTVIKMRSDPWAAPSVFGGVISKFFQNEPSVQAHRNRISMLSDDIATEVGQFKQRNDQGAFKILSVGCGPALEIQDYILNQKKEDLVSMRIVLVDINPNALEFARNGIREAAKQRGAIFIDAGDPEADLLRKLAQESGVPTIEVETRVENIIKEARRYGRNLPDPEKHVPVEEKYNMIFEAGIDDYVTDETAEFMTHKYSRMLLPYGVLEKTNVADTNPFDEARDIAFDWPIVSRNEARMRAQTDYLDEGMLEAKLRAKRAAKEEALEGLSQVGERPRTTQYAVNVRQDPTLLNHLMQTRLLPDLAMAA